MKLSGRTVIKKKKKVEEKLALRALYPVLQCVECRAIHVPSSTFQREEG
jgi:hypothetical protein